jgi:hypothetical protein
MYTVEAACFLDYLTINFNNVSSISTVTVRYEVGKIRKEVIVNYLTLCLNIIHYSNPGLPECEATMLIT